MRTTNGCRLLGRSSRHGQRSGSARAPRETCCPDLCRACPEPLGDDRGQAVVVGIAEEHERTTRKLGLPVVQDVQQGV